MAKIKSKNMPMFKLNCKTAIVSQSTGSAVFSLNATSVYCTIQGPQECPYRFEDPSSVYFDIRWRESTHSNSKATDAYFSNIIHEIIKKFVILEIDAYKLVKLSFYIVENEDKRCTLFCAVNACLAAMLDAGIPLKHMFYASSSFTCEEEVVVFDAVEKYQKRYFHCFGELTHEMEEIALNNLFKVEKYVKSAIKENMYIDTFTK